MSAGRNILAEIVEHKRAEVSRMGGGLVDADRLRVAVEERGGLRNFMEALEHPRAGDVGLIAEVKKASPSAGVIRGDFDPERIARQYEFGGASCLSVLTDERYFQGSLESLRRIRQAVKIPLLRKDFVIDARQILESIEWGADAVLLIASILDDALLARFHDLATGAGLAALVEVHDEAELDRAKAAGARLVGVNNRDLKTFRVDLGTTERLAGRLGRGMFMVSESGIYTRADVVRLRGCGAGAVLVGESLMKREDPAGGVRELLGVEA